MNILKNFISLTSSVKNQKILTIKIKNKFTINRHIQRLPCRGSTEAYPRPL